MTTGIILIVAILILGGVIATVGDRIGTRVGKARLSLFKLRPRKTAVLVTIVTGSAIAASTLGILFAADKSLRTGVFQLERIQKDLKTKRKQVESTTKELEATKIQKSNVEKDLQQARTEQKAAEKRQAQAQKRLQATNRSLQAVITKQTQTQAQLSRTQVKQAQTQAQLSRNQTQLSQITSRFLDARALLQTVSQQAKTLQAEIQKLQNERQQIGKQLAEVRSQIADRDEAIANLDQEIVNRDRDLQQRDRVIAGREVRLKQLESQREFLEQEVAKLEGYYQDYQVLRQGNVALESGSVLATGVVRIQQPKAARQAIEQLLREANRVAIESTQPGTNPENELAVQISKAQVEKVIAQIDDGRDYVVRVISAGNYLLGEKNVQAAINIAVNEVIFSKGDVLAAIPTNPSITGQEIRQKVGLLLSATKFRARRAGILGDAIEIGDGRLETLVSFIEQVRQYNQPVEIKAIAAEDIYTAGPSQVQLVAVKDGQVVFGTRRLVGNQLRDALTPKLTKARRATTKAQNKL